MWGIPRTNSPTKAWGWYVNGGDIFVFWTSDTSDIDSCTFLSWCKKLTKSMQTGLRPIMHLDGDTIVTSCTGIISNTGIILIRSPFPLSALYLSQILWYHANWNYVLLHNRHIWIKQKKSNRRHGCLSVVSVLCSQVEVSATSWSLVQRSPADCGPSLCVI